MAKNYKISDEQLIEIAMCIRDNKTLLKDVAEKYNLPKTTISCSFNTRLNNLDRELYSEVKKVLAKNRNSHFKTKKQKSFYTTENVILIYEHMMKENISLKKAAEDLGLFKNVIYKRFYKILNEIDHKKYLLAMEHCRKCKQIRFEKINQKRIDTRKNYIEGINDLQNMLRKKK